MRGVLPDVVAVAEDTNAYGEVPAACERIVTPEYVIWLSPRSGAPFTVVQRLRLRDDDVDAVVGRVRAFLRERNRMSSTWEVGSAATPPGLVERLLGLGMVAFEEPVAYGMVLAEPLPASPSGVVARRVETLEEYEAARRIMNVAFGSAAREHDPELTAREWREEAAAADRATYLAFVGDLPVAAAAMKYAGTAAVLNAAGTLPAARGRGAYRALIAARQQDAAARGVTNLVVQAGALSRPILRALGFVEVTEIRILQDDL